MSIGPNRLRPLAVRVSPSWLGPHSYVVVQEVGEVVWYEVFARHSQVHRVPVEELAAKKTGCRGVWGEGGEGRGGKGERRERGEGGEERGG